VCVYNEEEEEKKNKKEEKEEGVARRLKDYTRSQI
jgi:hypothetical protein